MAFSKQVKFKMMRLICIVLTCIITGFLQAQIQNRGIQQSQDKKAPLKSGIDSSRSTAEKLVKESSAFIYNNPDSGLRIGFRALEIYDRIQDLKGKVNAMNTIARAYYVKGSYDSSLIFSDQVLKISQLQKDTINIVIAMNNIGLVYLGHDKYKAAADQFSKTIVLAAAIRNNLQETRALFNLGICKDYLGEYELALAYLRKTIEKDQFNEEHHITLMAYDRLGKTQFHRKDFQAAIDNYLKVLNNKGQTDQWELSFANTGIAESYFAIGNYQLANQYALKGYQYAHLINAKWEAKQALDLLSKTNAVLNNFKEAYKYNLLVQIYKDSLNDQTRQQVLDSFKLEQKEAANLVLEKENKLNEQKIKFSTMLISIISGFAIIIVISFIWLFFNYKQKESLNQLLIKKNADIDSLNKMKDQLFYVISHDLRSPMASLQQSLELINKNILSEEKKNQLLNVLHQQVIVSSKMLNDLLAWATAQQHGLKVNRQVVKPGLIIHEVVSLFEIQAKRKEIELETDVDDVPSILADSNQLRIIIHNLISNAIKFSQAGGKVKVSGGIKGERVIINIIDNGVGISDEKQKQLFYHFGSKMSTPGTQKESGTGIGLMLVKDFADLNYAELQVESEIGKGSIFSITLDKA